MNVDVIIPVYNGEGFVARAVASVFAQDCAASLSVYCLDDESTDGSRACLESLAREEPRLHVSSNTRNIGVAATRNRGVGLGSAEFIAFLDQDDVWLSDKLSRQLAVFAARPELGYVVGQQSIVVDEGEERPSWVREEWLHAPQIGYLPSALVVRRSAFLRLGFFDESMRVGGDDSDWFARARRADMPHVHIDEPLLKRHVHQTNLSQDPRTDDELLQFVRRHVVEKVDHLRT